jgi:acyl-homoserine-lactone acylase
VIGRFGSGARPRLGLALLFAGIAAVTACSSSSAAQKTHDQLHASEILWDSYGVAHVYAKSERDLFYGFGWAQAHSHGNLLAKLYAEARGRAAEIYGEGEVNNDRWMLINDVPARSSEWLLAQSPDFRSKLEAFAAGINRYETLHPDEFSAEARQVFPVSAKDVVAHEQRVFQFIYAAPASIVDKIPSDAKTDRHEEAGSNGWAIAPSRSASGHAMILMNPHLPWPSGWSTYYEIQLRAPGINLYGATQVGLPVLRFMFNDYLAFTHTVNAPSAVTFYKLTPAPGGYLFDGHVEPFKQRIEELRVRQADGSMRSEAVTVSSSVQGPIVAERDGVPIAMRVAGLDRPLALDQYWRMDIARNFAEFQDAFKVLEVPTFNVVYADRAGHIEYLYNGLVPRHASGDLKFWSALVPGDSSDTLWKDYLTYQELPKVIDPPGGTVQNSNDPPWNAAWPTLIDPKPYQASIAAQSVSLRMERGIRMLGQSDRISYQQLIEDKWSTRSELADRVLPELLEAVQESGDDLARQAAAVLNNWDRTTNANSRGALLFLAWTKQKGSVSGYLARGWSTPFNLALPLTTPSGIADRAAAVAALDAAAKDMLQTTGALDTPWGQVMRLHIGDVDLPASGGPGLLGVFNVIDYADPKADGTRDADFGGSYVALVSFDSPIRAQVLLSYGDSSQPGSPHHSDQLPLLSRGQLRDAWLTRAEVEHHLEHVDRF